MRPLVLVAALALVPRALAADAKPSPPDAHGMAAPAAPGSPAAAQLERLKALAGTWTGRAGHAGAPAQEATVVYRVTGKGSAVVETLFPGQPHEMVTVYHLDRSDLLLTHYCAAGNQPTMRAVARPDPKVLAFEFVRGTNMEAGDLHMHAARMTFVDADHLESEWTSFKDGKPAGTMRLALARQR